MSGHVLVVKNGACGEHRTLNTVDVLRVHYGRLNYLTQNLENRGKIPFLSLNLFNFNIVIDILLYETKVNHSNKVDFFLKNVNGSSFNYCR